MGEANERERAQMERQEGAQQAEDVLMLARVSARHPSGALQLAILREATEADIVARDYTKRSRRRHV